VKKAIDMITDIAEDSEKYLKFYEQFSKNLKVTISLLSFLLSAPPHAHIHEGHVPLRIGNT
jgi:hypothetical protein